VVKAVVVLRQGAQVQAQDIIDFCKERLADFKKPRSVDFVKELPKNSNGKLSRKEVRERYWQGRDRKIN
jgi:acyl-coenzyme A synthetase/AMP-(fatty) acid ligase